MAKILLIEDNDMVLKSIENLLNKEGFNVTCAKNGREALDCLNSSGFHLVITDLMLPYVTGLDLIRQIKNDPTKKHTKIIVVSSKIEEESKIESYNLGIDEYLTKPIMPVELVLRVKKHLSSMPMQGRMVL